MNDSKIYSTKRFIDNSRIKWVEDLKITIILLIIDNNLIVFNNK
jgi:hypothetical protein